MENNIEEKEVPEFYRSAIDEYSKKHQLYENEKLFYFGIDWENKYIHWHIIAKSYDIKRIRHSIKAADLEWIK